MLQSVEVVTTRFDPVEAELAVIAVVDEVRPGLELRGRLMGPSCRYAETVEIAYHLRPQPPEGDTLRARIVIPEASFWDTSTPFLYQGPVELWEGQTKLAERRVAHGLRHLLLSAKGLKVNGRSLRWQGAVLPRWEPGWLTALHEEEMHVLTLDVTADAEERYDAADRLGFLLLGRLSGTEDELLWLAAEKLSAHPSCLGWVFPQTLLQMPQQWHNAMSLLPGYRKLPIGIEVSEPPLGVLPGHVSFLVSQQRHLEALQEEHVPKVLLTKRPIPKDEMPQGVTGWLHSRPEILLEG